VLYFALGSKSRMLVKSLSAGPPMEKGLALFLYGWCTSARVVAESSERCRLWQVPVSSFTSPVGSILVEVGWEVKEHFPTADCAGDRMRCAGGLSIGGEGIWDAEGEVDWSCKVGI
jgi:hypothetical protein